jgi:two-component system, LuxR family, sensor kinase FixL
VPTTDPAQRLLAAVTYLADDGIIETDLDGRVTTWSKGAERLFGYTEEEMLGKTLAVLMPDGLDTFTPVLARLGVGERLDHVDVVRVVKGGRLAYVSTTGTAVRDETGRVVGTVAIVRDISEAKRTDLLREATEARWRAIIDSAVDAIVVIDTKGRVEAFNRSAERMFGYAEAEMLGRTVNTLMPTPYRDEHDGYLASYLATGVQKVIGIGREVTGLRRNGSTFPVHLSVGEWQVGGERHFTGILHDLTERSELEERLREQTALARLGEMAAVIAHEIKNPLAAVRGAIQVIGGRLPAGSKDAPVVKEIVARLDALNDLIKDLLLFARTPQPRIASVGLLPLLQLTVDLLSKDPLFAGIHVVVTGDAPPIPGDAELLKIIFQNLLINAAQALQGHGTITVRIVPGATVHEVQVVDTGPGIAPDVREKVFRPFFTTKARGTGLGLSIARRLTEAHGGTTGVACPPEGGTQVTVALPAR